MSRRPSTMTTTRVLQPPLLLLLLLLLAQFTQVCRAPTVAIDTGVPQSRPPSTPSSGAEQSAEDRFGAPAGNFRNNNVTILHEVHEDWEERPISLNTHEVLPPKPAKKKPYTLFEKPLATVGYEKPPRPLKDYELHPVTFDFNLGDLEDLQHETFKKGDLSSTEEEVEHEEGDDDDDSAEQSSQEMISASNSSMDYYHSPTVVPEIEEEVPASGSSTESETNFSSETSATFSSPVPVEESVNGTQNATLSSEPTVVSVSPHIFKILKNKSSKKGRELLHKRLVPKRLDSDHHVNRLQGHQHAAPLTTDGEHSANATHATTGAGNVLQVITNLYDHFYWLATDIRPKVSTGCALEMQAYLTGLHANSDWAQKAYDASGRYRGQLLFGNDKWLGQKNFCTELNLRLRPTERRHFQFQFYVALISLRLRMPHRLDVNLQLGECLPKTCSALDVQRILEADPHSHMLSAEAAKGPADNKNATSGWSAAQVFVHRVRPVPGSFNYWHEMKFQVFVSLLLCLLLLVLTATCFQAKLNREQLLALAPIPAISAKVDTANPGCCVVASLPPTNGGKAKYELYQMTILNDNNNHTTADMEMTHAPSTTGLQLPYKGAQLVDNRAPVMPELPGNVAHGATYEAKRQLALHERLLLCFAFQTNTATILNIDDRKGSQTSCVHGLRVLSILWTILVHTYLQIFTIGENRFQRVIVERSIWYQFVGNATFSVDTFFFISGFLIALLFLKQEKRPPQSTKQFLKRSLKDTVLLWLYRYLRLTPAYLFVIFLNDFSLRETFDNSVFQATVSPTTCGQFWWRNILYVNNFYPLTEICMIWSWYMANDMQFYILATILLVVSTRYFKTAIAAICGCLMSSWLVAGTISLHYHYTHKVANPFESFDFLYDKPWQRVGTYLVGMMAGYVLYKVKTPPRISGRTNGLLWCASLGLLGVVIFGVWRGELTEVQTAFYVSVGHTGFSLGLVWVVLSCCWGLAPTVNRVLSYRCLWPLSRLTYCTYLIHPLIMLVVSYRMDGTVHLNNLFVCTIFFGNAVLSFVAAFIISVLFEAPAIRMLKIFFRKGS